MRTYLVDFENVKSKGLVGIDKLGTDDNVIIFYSENSDTISFEMHCLVLKAKANVEYMKVRVGGKNALDFQLSTLLGYIVAKENNSHVFVISGDKGFDKLHDFWENTFPDAPKCKVYRTANIASALNYIRGDKKISDSEIFDNIDISDRISNDIENADITTDADIKADGKKDIDIKNNILPMADIYTEVLSGKVVEIKPEPVPDSISKLIPDVTDEERELLKKLFISTDSKLDLHNELMKKLDNERSTYLYNNIKGSYYTMKNEYSDDKAAAPQPAAKPAEPAQQPAEAKPAAKPKTTAKAAAQKQTKPAEKPEQKKAPAKKRASKTKPKTPELSDGDKRLHELADGFVNDKEYEKLRGYVIGSDSAHSLYLSLIKGFGKKRGTAVYNEIKKEHKSLLSAFGEKVPV